jgi:transposase
MMGPRQDRHSKLFYAGVSIEERLDFNHPLRKIHAAVDFAFVRQQVAPLYGVRGNPSLDPTLVLKLLFLLFYENVSSERELLRQLPCRLDWLWFLSMDLDSAIPDHSVLSKARKRWGSKVFTGFFKKVLGQCVAAGLVDGARVHIDGSLIDAHADQGKLALALEFTGETLYGQLEAAEERGAAAGTPAATAAPAAAATSAAALIPTAPSTPAPAATSASLAAPAGTDASPAAIADTLQEASLPVPPGTLYSPTDPEARLTRKYGRCVLGYKDHRVIDDRCGIITATLTTAASAAESSMLEKVMDQHESNTGLTILEPTADKGYGTVDNYCMLRERRCVPVIPHPLVREDKTMFPRSVFIYDSAQDVYRCPAGQLLHRRGGATEGRHRYQTQAGVCESCPLRARCTASSKTRLLSRQVHQDAIEWADSRLSPHQRKARMRRRKIRAEGSFADSANHHGYKRARWRGSEKMTIQNLLIATAQNLRKLMRVRPKIRGEGAGRSPRHAAGLPLAVGLAASLRPTGAPESGTSPFQDESRPIRAWPNPRHMFFIAVTEK